MEGNTLSTLYSGRRVAIAYMDNRYDPLNNSLEGKIDADGMEKMFVDDDSAFISGFASGIISYIIAHPIKAYRILTRDE